MRMGTSFYSDDLQSDNSENIPEYEYFLNV